MDGSLIEVGFVVPPHLYSALYLLRETVEPRETIFRWTYPQ